MVSTLQRMDSTKSSSQRCADWLDEASMLCQRACALTQWVVGLPRGQRRPLARDDALLRAVERSSALASFFDQLVYYHNADAWVKRLASNILAAYDDRNTLQPKIIAAVRGGWCGLIAYLAEQSTRDDALDSGRGYASHIPGYQSHMQRCEAAMRASLHGPAAVWLACVYHERCTWDTRMLGLTKQVMQWHATLRQHILFPLPASNVVFEHLLILADEAQTATQRHIVRAGLRGLRHLGQLPIYQHQHHADVERAASVSFWMPNGDALCAAMGACRTDQWRFLERLAFCHHPKPFGERVWREAAEHGSLRCVVIFLRHWGPSIFENVDLSMLSAGDVYREGRLRRIVATADFLCAVARGCRSPFAPPKLLHIRAVRGVATRIYQRLRRHT